MAGAAPEPSVPPPSYGTEPAPSVPKPPPAPAPVVPITPDPAPADPAGPSAVEQKLTLQVRRLQRRLAVERKQHRSALRRERRRATVRLARVRRAAWTESDVQHAFALAGATYGVSQSKLSRVSFCESGHNPGAVNGRYLGLFQFGTSLWRTTPYAAFSRADPYAASLAASWAFARGMHRHWPECGSR